MNDAELQQGSAEDIALRVVLVAALKRIAKTSPALECELAASFNDAAFSLRSAKGADYSAAIAEIEAMQRDFSGNGGLIEMTLSDPAAVAALFDKIPDAERGAFSTEIVLSLLRKVSGR